VSVDAENDKSATSVLREWMRDYIQRAGEVNVKAMAQDGVRRLADDQDLLNQFVTERVWDMAAEVGRAVLRETRQVRRFWEGAARTPEERRERLDRWFQRMEHQPVRGTYNRLGVMRKADLVAAAEERVNRARPELVTARWFLILAEGMDDEHTVAETYRPDAVARAYDTAGDFINANLDALMRGVDEALRRVMGDGPGGQGDEPQQPQP